MTDLSSTPGLQSSMNNTGAITNALLNALDQIQRYIAKSQFGPDGKPLGTSVYMQLPLGVPVDPKDYANAWTPGGGDSSSSFDNTGNFVAPAAATASPGATAGNGTGPAGSMYPPPTPAPNAPLEASLNAALNTSLLVDNMLQVTNNGVAVSWPDRRVSIEYYAILQGIQPQDTSPPAQDVLNRVAAAQGLLFIKDNNGNSIGYTPLYAQYRKFQKTWTDAIGAQAAAYAKAMSDPVAGQAWPVEAATYANAVTQALDDFNANGRVQVEAALNTIATEGHSAVSALVALGKQLFDAYGVQLSGSVSAATQWSFLSPSSWWDYTDDSFGAIQITASSTAYESSGGTNTSSFANNWQRQQSSSTSGGGGINIGIASASASGSHSDASNADASHAGQFTMQRHQDKSSKAEISFEFFMATIDRPWFLGDLFNIQGWYLYQQRKDSISDGTVIGQLYKPDDKNPKLLPMVPKAFVIMRNVKITADDWGDAGTAFSNAQQNAAGSGQSSSNSFGASASYLWYSANMQHADQQSSGAFGQDQSAVTGFVADSTGNGGTLTLMGSQIIGWIGEIQPECPLIDDPTLPKPKTTADPAGAATPAPALGPIPAPAP